MNFTLWILGLGAVGAILYFGRRKWQRKAFAKEFDKAKRKRDAENSELDRQACLDLGKSLMASVPGSRAESGESASGGGRKPG